jgi:hypothetical protein
MIAEMGPVERFERFRSLVLADPALEARLRSLPDWPSFIQAAVEVAAEHEIPLVEDDLLAARQAARRTWRERWV